MNFFIELLQFEITCKIFALLKVLQILRFLFCIICMFVCVIVCLCVMCMFWSMDKNSTSQ